MDIEIVPDLKQDKPSRPRWRIAKRNGERVRVRVVDADSPMLGADLLAAFRWSVRQIRRINGSKMLPWSVWSKWERDAALSNDWARNNGFCAFAGIDGFQASLD